MKIFRRSLPLLLSFCIAAVFVGCGDSGDAPVRYTHVFTISDTQSSEPFGMAVKGDTLLLSDGSTGTILEIENGSSRVFASGLNTPSAIAFLPGGDLVVADTGSHTIRKISVDGTVSLVAGMVGTPGFTDGPAETALFNAPVGIAVSDNGAIYISDTYNDRIRVIRDGVVSTVTGSVRGFADGVGSDARFDTPLGIAIWNENLLVADSGNARVRVIHPNGTVETLAGSDQRDLLDGTLASARFVMPTAIATDRFGRIFVADGNAIRVIGHRIFPFVETLAGDRRGLRDGNARMARFNRPSGLAIGPRGQLYVADSDNQAVRSISDDNTAGNANAPAGPAEDPLPLATRWPFDPPDKPREIAGTLGEIRGEINEDGKPVWFHNGLDIAGAYGETTKFIRDETVLDPHAAENFGTSRELLRLPLIGYIHLRLGRDKDDRTFGDPRFQFDRDTEGKLIGVRVPRGTRFAAGDPVGTLNAMNHVHLIAGRAGREINALHALDLPGVTDSIAPVIENVLLYYPSWDRVEPSDSVPLPEKVRIVVQAYDRVDGNSERRRLGVFKIGYQVLKEGASIGQAHWGITFEKSPSNDVARFAYADGSRSGYTPDTVFRYIATNHVDGDVAREEFLDLGQLASGKYTVRVFVADYFGNTATKDIELMK